MTGEEGGLRAVALLGGVFKAVSNVPSLLSKASEDLLKQHYIDLKDRPFYPGLVKYMSSGPVVAMVSS